MATSAYASTPETTNANRASRVLLGPCSDQLRDVLRRRVDPVNFHHVIRHNRPNLPRLTLPQKDLILPRTGHYSGNYSDMDISLLYLLLRNICNIQPHMNGWGNNPNVSDHSLAASIERIHLARNKVGHSSSTYLSQPDFTDIWSYIKDAVQSMDSFLNNGKKYEKEMDFLFTETMDPTQEFYIDQLRKQLEEERETREIVMQLRESMEDHKGEVQKIRTQQQESQRQIMDQQLNIQDLGVQQQESQRQIMDQHLNIQDLGVQQQVSQRQIIDQQLNIQDLEIQQQESRLNIQDLGAQQQESRRHIIHQQMSIQDLGVQQQESQRHIMDQQLNIQDLGVQQQVSQRQIMDQQLNIQDFEIQQEESRLNIQDLGAQQQESQRQITDQQGHILYLRTQQEDSRRQISTLTDNVQGQSAQMADLTHRIQQLQVVQDVEPDLNRLRERLVELNDLEIPLSPLQEDSDKLPVEQLFASVIIKEDSKETRKGKKSAQGEKEQELKKVKTPEDMLTKNCKPVRRMYMLGDAAHGKTTYCTWLLKKWCNAQKPGICCRPLNEWENALSQFDFVFHLKFRHVDPSRSNVTDMICQDMLGEDTGLQPAAKHVLSSNKYRCLIIMDGLDEWKPDQSVIAQLKYKAMPNIDNMSNCVIFTTMRPWMFAAVAESVRDEDRVIEIQGLDDKGIEDVIEKVLVHYYEMKPNSDEYTAKHNEIISKLEDKTLKSFIHIPLLAVVCIQIWCEGEQVGDSLTSFYVAMVNMLIERAQVKKQIPKLFLDTTNISLPRILSAKKNIKCFSNVLLKLGKVAYEGLISKQMKLVFQKDDLESEIGERELKFALDVGLISQTEAPGITTRKVNVHFFHKSVQEFLAVMYIVTQKKVSDNFCTRLCNVKVIMELSNVIMFICGMCPSLGSVISQIVVSVTDNDGEICKYRESPWLEDDTTKKELYKLQVSWYRELQYGQTDSQVTFHVSDVYLDPASDTETVRVTRELLSGHHDIRSLMLVCVPTDGEDGITDTELGDFLSNIDKTRSLIMLYILGDTGRSVHTLCGPSLRFLCLYHVTIQDRDSVRPVITQTDRLQRLWLSDVSLGDRGLGLTPHMTDLQWVVLHTVRMTQSGWGRLIQSVIDVHHQFVVILLDTDIDSDSVSTLHSSPHISVTRDDDDDDDGDDDDDDDMVGI